MGRVRPTCGERGRDGAPPGDRQRHDAGVGRCPGGRSRAPGYSDPWATGPPRPEPAKAASIQGEWSGRWRPTSVRLAWAQNWAPARRLILRRFRAFHGGSRSVRSPFTGGSKYFPSV